VWVCVGCACVYNCVALRVKIACGLTKPYVHAGVLAIKHFSHILYVLNFGLLLSGFLLFKLRL